MKQLYTVCVKWSQTDHDNYGIWATSRQEAQEKADQAFPGARYREIGPVLKKIIE
jgi:hypothetical protein